MSIKMYDAFQDQEGRIYTVIKTWPFGYADCSVTGQKYMPEMTKILSFDQIGTMQRVNLIGSMEGGVM